MDIVARFGSSYAAPPPLLLTLCAPLFHNPSSLHSSWTNKLITAKDHAAVQLNIAHLDDDGVYTGAYTTFALSGKTRSMGESDSALDHLWAKKKAEVGQTY